MTSSISVSLILCPVTLVLAQRVHGQSGHNDIDGSSTTWTSLNQGYCQVTNLSTEKTNIKSMIWHNLEEQAYHLVMD